MEVKYQVLVDTTNKKVSVIERSDNVTGKEYWNVYIPDAGDRSTAARVSRLLNEEHQAVLARRESRETNETPN